MKCTQVIVFIFLFFIAQVLLLCFLKTHSSHLYIHLWKEVGMTPELSKTRELI